MDKTTVIEFAKKLTQERIDGSFAQQDYLFSTYQAIVQNLSVDYQKYRIHVATLLSALEHNNDHSIAYELKLFFDLYNRLISVSDYKTFDESIVHQDSGDMTWEKMKSVMDDYFSKSAQPRLSDAEFDLAALSTKERKQMSSLLLDVLQKDSKKLNWDKGQVEVTMIQLIFLRSLLVSMNEIELFYHAVGIFFDRLLSSEFYQAGRDIAEEVIICSYKDNVPELGYFEAFRLYAGIGSIHGALLYANLSMVSVLRKSPPYSEKYIKEIVWHGIKLFRAVKLVQWAQQLYQQIPVTLSFRDYERRSIDHTYLTTFLFSNDKSAPQKILDYLHKEREAIIAGGVSEAMPWLLTLYNVRRMFKDANFSHTGLGFYVYVFEQIVPAASIQKYKDIIEGNSGELINHLKESLVKLNETRNRADFVYDNEQGLRISSRLIEYSATHNSIEGFLLAMVLKSDYSILFQPKESLELAPLILPDIDVKQLQTLYGNIELLLNRMPLFPNTSVIWLAFTEGALYELELFNGTFMISRLQNWDYRKYQGLLSSDYFVNLSFDETSVDGGTTRQILPEEFARESIEIATQLQIAKLKVSHGAESILLIKDMEISRFPHNLFLDDQGGFIAQNVPVTHVLSTEWFLQTSKENHLTPNFSKSIWLPVESGDFALNYLYSKLEETLQREGFNTFTTSELDVPLSSDINIICSHGAENISEVQILYQENNSTQNLNTVIGRGKILIFFVCYSGSMKTEFYRNNIVSLVKRFIAQGYEAVIAPFWALDVTIPVMWLPEFLNSLGNGFLISTAVSNANKAVLSKYPTPAAWACLHLYGNPHIRVEHL